MRNGRADHEEALYWQVAHRNQKVVSLQRSYADRLSPVKLNLLHSKRIVGAEKAGRTKNERWCQKGA